MRHFFLRFRKQFVDRFGLERWNKFQSYAAEDHIDTADGFDLLLVVERCNPHDCGAENALLLIVDNGTIFLGCFYREIYDRQSKRTFNDIEFIGNGWFVHTRFPVGSYNTDNDQKPHYSNCSESWGTVVHDIYGSE